MRAKWCGRSNAGRMQRIGAADRRSGRNVVRSSRTHSCASCASHGERRVVRRPSLCCDRWRRVRPFVSERQGRWTSGSGIRRQPVFGQSRRCLRRARRYETVLEYSHRGKLLQTLQTYDVPQSCSVDPTTGNLAVPTVDYSCVYIYPNARPPGTIRVQRSFRNRWPLRIR